MNWKTPSLIALLTIVTISATADAQFRRYPQYPPQYRQPTTIVIPSIQVGQNGPVITPGVQIGNGTTILPQIQPQRRGINTLPVYPVNPGFIDPRYPRYPTVPVVPTIPRYTSEKSLERRVEFCLKQKFGRIIKDVDVDVDFDDHEVEVEVEVRDFRYARSIRAYVLTLPELQGFRVDLDLDR